jgi:acyl-CoA reductase-like NAD-dependent aldehyde dehydrogenase
MVELEEVQDNYGRLKLFIDGKWVDSHSTSVQPVMNPAKAQSIAEVPYPPKFEKTSNVEATYSELHPVNRTVGSQRQQEIHGQAWSWRQHHVR